MSKDGFQWWANHGSIWIDNLEFQVLICMHHHKKKEVGIFTVERIKKAVLVF